MLPPFTLTPSPASTRFPGAYNVCPFKSRVPLIRNSFPCDTFSVMSWLALKPFIFVSATNTTLSFCMSSSLNPFPPPAICTFCTPVPFNITLWVPPVEKPSSSLHTKSPFTFITPACKSLSYVQGST